MPASAIGSLTRTARHTGGSALERSQGVRDTDAGLDLRAEVGEPELDRGERRRHVEDVVVADVADAEHGRPQRAVALRELDAVPLAKLRDELAGIDPWRRLDRRDDGRRVVVR